MINMAIILILKIISLGKITSHNLKLSPIQIRFSSHIALSIEWLLAPHDIEAVMFSGNAIAPSQIFPPLLAVVFRSREYGFYPQ